MMKRLVIASICWLVCIGPLCAQDYRVEPLAEAPPSDAFQDGIASALAKTGARVIRGTSRTVCDIWLCSKLETKEGFTPSNTVLYPFEEGQLIGAARFPRDGRDFRDQEIPRGLYTMRYMLQPVDGAHVGTSVTRDFLLLVSAEGDENTQELDPEQLVESSTDVVGATHPAVFALQRHAGEAATEPQIRHDEQNDWWIATLHSTDSAGKPLVIDLVVVGIGHQ